MNTTSRAGWLVLALVCAANMIFAQTTISEDLQRADKQFDLYAYNLALKTYKQVLEKDANNGHALARIADCYFQLNQPEVSLDWYRRAVAQREPNSDVQFRYGKALMQRGDYENARKQFIEYAALNDNANSIGRHYADMCDFAARTAKKAPDYIARNEAVNTSAADFSPVFYNNRVVYSSARTDIVRKTQSKTSSDWSGSSYNQLFITQRNPENGALQKPDFLRNDLQNNYNESPVSFSADGKKVAFCRNNYINGTRQIAEKGVNMSLYIADVVNGEWTNVKAFPYNGTDFATGFPFLIGVGNTLMFASNNPASTTGGKGWDIYISHFVNDEWSTPRNLGAPVNTPGNEVTPFYDGSDMYFSSDWHNGLGGLDVFRAEVGKENVKNVFHLGPGINSSSDDYGFIYNSQTKTGYLTSNRSGGRGNEDIWQISKTGDNATTPMTYSATTTSPSATRSLSDVMAGRSATTPAAQSPATYAFSPQGNAEESTIRSYYLFVTDAFGKPLPGVDVDMFECSGERGQTDMEGKFYFTPASRPSNCNIDLSKSGYESTRVEVREFGQRNITASLGLDKRQEFEGVVLDARTRQPLSDVTIDFVDQGKIIRTTTDASGKYALLLLPGATYNVEYSRFGYSSAKVPTRPSASLAGYRIPDVVMYAEGAGITPSSSAYQPAAPATTMPIQYSNPTVAQPTQYQYTTPSTYNYTPVVAQPASTRLVTASQPEVLPDFNGYSIQLSALPSNATDSDTRKFEPLAKHGNVYTKSEDGKNKVRLGIFPTKDEAQKTLKEVNKNQQFKGAFIVEERGADKSLILGQQASSAAAPAQYSTTSNARSIAGAPATVSVSGVCYAIQLSAQAADKPISVNDYSGVSNLGHVYGKMESGSMRMRLGVWSDYSNAEAVLAQVTQRGFKDAFIVTEKANDESIKGYILPGTVAPATTQTAPVTYSTQTKTNAAATRTISPSVNDAAKYYVRLCALSDPGRFDADKLEGAGVSGNVEKWPVGNTGLTAIMLTGYTSLTEANRDKEKVRSNGFPEAYIVREVNGTITKM
ncbi:MAG: hypothetical protein EPGJADBJ_02876 [Saprospiraceae bacterium]|nr:hypothetical protein [Saprospiraceae bacterium]